MKQQHKAAEVDPGYFWQPMSTCPRGTKVQLLNPGHVACYGQYNGEPFWKGWAPLPKIPKYMKERK